MANKMTDLGTHVGGEFKSHRLRIEALEGFEETVTNMSLVANQLSYTDENGATVTYDLSTYLDDTNLARLVGGTYNPTSKKLVFTRDDGSEFNIDASMFLDDTNLVTSVNGQTGAVTVPTYSHPTHPGDDMSVDTGALSGATVISDLDFNVTTDTKGHVTDANATVSTRNITLGDLGYTGDTNATNYSHPSTHPATMITTTDEFAYSNSTNVQDVLDDLDQAIANVNAKDPVIALTGDVTGSGTMTNLGNVSINATVADNSHSHDDQYYTESEINTFLNRGYVSNHTASNLPVGWYTIATNSGNRASARFGIWDKNSSDHQSVTFYAAHNYGTDSSNTLTVLDNSHYIGTPFRYIRTKDNGVYDGAALQIYIDDSSNNVYAAILGDNFQSSGWVLCDWVPDATTPPGVSNYSGFGERGKVDLNQIAQGGFATTGEIYAGGDTSQHRVFHDAHHPNADKWTTARTLSLTGDVTGSTSFDGSGNASITATVADDSHNHTIANIDGLQTALDNATMSASEILTAIKTVDGSGTGLDADLLDGKDSGAFNQIIGTDTDVNTSGATIIDNLYMTDGVVTSHGTRVLTPADIGAAASSHTHAYNAIIGTDTDLNTAGNQIIDNIYVTDGVITSMGTRNLTAADLSAIKADSYATDTVGGTVKMRVSGTTLYLTNDGTNA